MDAVSINNARPIVLYQGQVQEDMMAAMHQLQLQLPISGRGNGEMSLVNWGRRQEGTDLQWQHLALGEGLSLAFYDEEKVVFTGEITAIEERYGSGTPLLVLLLEDKMHRLARHRQSQAFEESSPDDVIQSLASGQGLQADVSVSETTGDWYQLNETDYNFMQRIVHRWDITCRIVDGDTLRVKAEQEDPEPVTVSPQANALKVRIIADLNHQSQAVGLRGWNFSSGELLEDESSQLVPAPQQSSAADSLDTLGWSEQQWLSGPSPRSPDEAREWAKAGFQKQARRFLYGEITLQGEPRLKVGGEITLEDVSDRIAGRYRIVNLCHRFDAASGFVSHIRVERADWSPQS